jgi:sulfide:quinone oxidoreductase
VVGNGPNFQFVPSNPWVAVRWRKRTDVEFAAAPYLERRGIGFDARGAKRVHPERSKVELADGTMLDYDYLVIATGPKLAFDEVEGLGPNGHTQSICHVEHAEKAAAKWDAFVTNPGPIVVGAVQGASCYGPAYEFAFIMDTDLRRRRLRDKVPMTFVTAEPYIGHLGLGGVGDSKTMLESALRERHIKWICNAKVAKVEAGTMHVVEHDDEGKPKKEHTLPFAYSMMLPAFKGIDAVAGIEGLTNPRGFILVDAHQRNPKYQNIYSSYLRSEPRNLSGGYFFPFNTIFLSAIASRSIPALSAKRIRYSRMSASSSSMLDRMAGSATSSHPFCPLDH